MNHKLKRRFFFLLIFFSISIPVLNVKADELGDRKWTETIEGVTYSYYPGHEEYNYTTGEWEVVGNTLMGIDGQEHTGSLLVINIPMDMLEEQYYYKMGDNIYLDKLIYQILGIDSYLNNYVSVSEMNKVKEAAKTDMLIINITGGVYKISNEIIDMKIEDYEKLNEAKYGYVRINADPWSFSGSEESEVLDINTNIIPADTTDIISSGEITSINESYENKYVNVEKTNIKAKTFLNTINGAKGDYNLYWDSYEPLKVYDGYIYTTLTVHPLKKTGYHAEGAMNVNVPLSGKIVLNNSFVPDEYNVTLNYIDDLGEKAKAYKGTYDSEYTFLEVPARTGYSFTGYTRSDGKEIDMRSTIDIAADHSVTANYRVNKYTVKFDAGEGKVLNTSKLVTYDSMYGTLPIPERAGYDFVGWYMGDKKMTGSDTVSTAGTHTFTARYLPKTVEVLLDAAGGDCELDSIKVVSGETYGSLPIPAKEGCEFDGWYLKDSKVEETTLLSESNYYLHTYGIALVAHWKDRGAATFDNKGAETGQNGESGTNDEEEIGESIVLNIRPSVKSLKVKNIKGRKIKILLTGVNVTGYQIKYSTSKKFSGSKTVNTTKQTYKTKKLKKGKTYYVKARAYSTTVNGDKIFGAWSGIKKVRIKR